MVRRSRMYRTRSGNRIALSPRDIAIFEVLSRYRYLRSTYLHAFTGGASATRFKERLGDLFHEGYLDRPQQQWEYADARYRPVVHEMGERGMRALQELGELPPSVTFLGSTSHRQFRHSLMLCEAMASMELACRDIGVRFISWPEILRRAPEASQTSLTPWRLPVPSGRYLVPDGLFGIEYKASETKSYRFFALETDRGTMPVSRSKPGHTSYVGKLEAYGEALARRQHNTHWGIPNLIVLTVTTSASRQADIIAKIGAGSPAFLFKSLQHADLTHPRRDLVTDPWERVGYPPFCIAGSS